MRQCSVGVCAILSVTSSVFVHVALSPYYVAAVFASLTFSAVEYFLRFSAYIPRFSATLIVTFVQFCTLVFFCCQL